MRTSKTILLICCFLLALFSAHTSSALGQIFVFGDSISDDGDAYAKDPGALPASPPYQNHFSNGPVAVNVLASNLGIALGPSATGGTDYAVGGATTGTTNFLADGLGITAFGNTGIATQVANFTHAPPTFNTATSLFVVWGGPNDFLLAQSQGMDPSTVASQAVNNLSAEITQLASAGARHFLIPNMADFSLSPYDLGLGSTAQAQAHQAIMNFNSGLATAIGTLRGQLPTSDIKTFDTYSALNAILANPAAYGFTNVTSPCVVLSPGFTIASVCSDPSTYLWWDFVHPSAATHEILGSELTAAVPEPSTLSLAVLGLLTLGATRKARRHGG